MPGLSPQMGAAMAEAAAVCLDDCGHPRPVRITVDGDASGVFDLRWRAVDDRDRRTWADEGVATEYGACAIAILRRADHTRPHGTAAIEEGNGIRLLDGRFHQHAVY